jgi:hypothetical protein
MRSIRHVKAGIGVAVLAACLAGPAFGASKISYIATMGGDNHAADWKASTRTQYSGADEADGQYFQKTLPVPYAIKLKAEGVHSQSGHASDGFEIYGAANCVFNVELYKDSESGALATGATFYSTINDGTSGDPTANAAFALSYLIGGKNGRLIDTSANGGPCMQPIFTYPTAQPGKLIGQGAGYKEWAHTSATYGTTYTTPGIGMATIPGGASGLGVVPIAEGQIDMSTLEDGTYVLKVVPGAGNNVLRGDLTMTAATNRPAFAVASNETAGDTITFTIGSQAPCVGVVGRHILYNNSKWDNNTPAVTSADWTAIAPDKYPLLPGAGTAVAANWTTYGKSLNCIVVDACHFNRVPVVDTDIAFVMGNSTDDPFTWTETAPIPTLSLFPGEGANGSDRLVIQWADNAIPDTRWVLVGLFADDPTLGLPESDYFIFGVAIGDGNGNRIVNAVDEAGCRPPNTHNALNPAPIDDPWDYNRDRNVNAVDEVLARPPYVTNALTCLKSISW